MADHNVAIASAIAGAKHASQLVIYNAIAQQRGMLRRKPSPNVTDRAYFTLLIKALPRRHYAAGIFIKIVRLAGYRGYDAHGF